MLDNLDLTQVLFLDIETVSGQPVYYDLDDTFQSLWILKAQNLLKKSDEEITEEEIALLYEQRAGIYAEFGKIVCISVGLVFRNPETKQLGARFKSFAGEDEALVLNSFAELLNKHYNNPDKFSLCGHNIKEFDIPYICRRMLIHQMQLPPMLDISGKKPWETKHLLDTLELWKFGDHKNFTSLKLLAALFGFPSPKDDIDGSEVGRVYWEENDVERISKYCEKDVKAVIQLLLRFKRLPLLES